MILIWLRLTSLALERLSQCQWSNPKILVNESTRTGTRSRFTSTSASRSTSIITLELTSTSEVQWRPFIARFIIANILKSSILISLHNMLPFELTKDTPYLALSGELWSVFYEYFNRNWPCYKGFLLYEYWTFRTRACHRLLIDT